MTPAAAEPDDLSPDELREAWPALSAEERAEGLRLRERQDELDLLARGDAEEEVFGRVAGKELQAFRAFLGGERRPRVAQLVRRKDFRLRHCGGHTLASRNSSAALKSLSSRSRIGLPLSARTRLNTSMT